MCRLGHSNNLEKSIKPSCMETGIIDSLIAPVVMISACGVLYMALSNRLVTIVTRIREFHSERFLLSDKVFTHDEKCSEADKIRFEGVFRQTEDMLSRARLVRNSLLFFISTVVCMLLASLMIGLSLLIPTFGQLSVVVFILGAVSMLLGTLLAGVEMSRSLQQVEYEHKRVEQITLLGS